MPTALDSGVALPELSRLLLSGLCLRALWGTGGALGRSHLRCTTAAFSLSWKTFSPPARKESLTMLAASSVPWSILSGAGFGESGLATVTDGEGEIKDIPQISHARRDGWFLKVHLGHSTDGFSRDKLRFDMENWRGLEGVIEPARIPWPYGGCCLSRLFVPC